MLIRDGVDHSFPFLSFSLQALDLTLAPDTRHWIEQPFPCEVPTWLVAVMHGVFFLLFIAVVFHQVQVEKQQIYDRKDRTKVRDAGRHLRDFTPAGRLN